MNVVTLYVSTCKYVLQADPKEPETWKELYRYLPHLKQALSCCVCAKFLNQAMGPHSSKCQHYVCRHCLGGKMRLKPVCGWCNDHRLFIEKRHLDVLLGCYKRLCEYLLDTPIAKQLNNIAAANGGATSNVVSILQEVLAIPEVEQRNSRLSEVGLDPLGTLKQPPVSGSEERDFEKERADSSSSPRTDREINMSDDFAEDYSQALYSVVSLSNNSVDPKLKIKRKPKVSGKKSKLKHIDKAPGTKASKRAALGGSSKKKCRCGTGGSVLHRNTCSSQRCPCFSSSLSCAHCKCRGCQNPVRDKPSQSSDSSDSYIEVQ